MAKKLLIILTLATAVAVLASCAGIPLMSQELMLSKEQKEKIEAAKKEESQEGQDKQEGQKKKDEGLIRPVPQVPEDILFTLIYLLGEDLYDKRRAVILDLEEDGIEFIPTVPHFEYEILQNVSISEAIYETEIFFGHEAFITNYYFKKILGLRGRIIGYEIRPTYIESLYGSFDPLRIKYKFKRRRVSVSIELGKVL